jgi:hypothetical protein
MRIDPFSLISAQAAKAPAQAAARSSEPAKAEFTRLEIPKVDTPNKSQNFTLPERLGTRLDIKV